MLKLDGDTSGLFFDVVTDWLEQSGDQHLASRGLELLRALLQAPDPAATGGSAAGQWFASMAPAPVANDDGHEGHGGGGGQDATAIVEAIGVLTAFTRGDLDL